MDESSHGCKSSVVLFRPREWRGIAGGLFGYYRKSPQKMAKEVGSYPRGTVAYVYMSSDEGLALDNSFQQMLCDIPNHVQLVSAEAVGELALQATEAARSLKRQRRKAWHKNTALCAVAILVVGCLHSSKLFESWKAKWT